MVRTMSGHRIGAGQLEKEYAGRVDTWKSMPMRRINWLRSLHVYAPDLIAYRDGKDVAKANGGGSHGDSSIAV